MIGILESYRVDIDYVDQWYLFEFVLVAFDACLNSLTNWPPFPNVTPEVVKTLNLSAPKHHRSKLVCNVTMIRHDSPCEASIEVGKPGLKTPSKATGNYTGDL